MIDVNRANKQEQGALTGLSDIRTRAAKASSMMPTFSGPTPSQVFTEQDPDVMASSAGLAGQAVQQRRDLARKLAATGIKSLTAQGSLLETDANAIGIAGEPAGPDRQLAAFTDLLALLPSAGVGSVKM